MITFLRGKLVDALPTQVTIEVNGVGYDVLIPLSSFDKLPPVGQDKVVSAVVRVEDTDRNSPAVSVEIAGREVGHLSPADARALRRRAGRDGAQFKCRAAIHAGWKRGRVHYDLRLDVNLGADRPGGVVSL